MPVIKLKITSTHQQVPHILTRFQALTGFDLTYWRKDDDLFAVFMTSEQHVEWVMTAEVRANLANEGMKVVKSDGYLANSTLIAKDLPRSLQNKSEDIASDISSSNDVDVVRVDWKGQDTLFIEFNTIEDATKVLNTTGGMRLSYERSINQLRKKPFTKIPQCSRCFSFEHDNDSCPKTVRTCYHCGREGHAGEECSTTYIRCVNCCGDHVAFALKCPVREKKEREMKEDGYCAPDRVGRIVASRPDKEDEEESTKRAEEEVSIILGVDKLLLQNREECEALQASSYSFELCNQTTPRAIDSLQNPSTPSEEVSSGDLPETTLGSNQQRSPCTNTLRGQTEDPLPVFPRRTCYPEDRPPSRLGYPVSPSLHHPVPRKSPLSSPLKSPLSPETEDECDIPVMQAVTIRFCEDSTESPPQRKSF